MYPPKDLYYKNDAIYVITLFCFFYFIDFVNMVMSN